MKFFAATVKFLPLMTTTLMIQCNLHPASGQTTTDDNDDEHVVNSFDAANVATDSLLFNSPLFRGGGTTESDDAEVSSEEDIDQQELKFHRMVLNDVENIGNGLYYDCKQDDVVVGTKWPKERFIVTGKIVSPNGRYVFQKNKYAFFLYDLQLQKFKWVYDVYRSQQEDTRLKMQKDGQLKLYDLDGNTLWTTDTWTETNEVLVLQDDGNLVIIERHNVVDEQGILQYCDYDQTKWMALLNPSQEELAVSGTYTTCERNNAGTEWPSGEYSGAKFMTSPNGRYEFHFDSGLLFVFDNQERKKTWIINDHSGRSDSIITMQGDGNLVLYDNGNPLWASDTDGNWGSKLVMQDDGNLVIYNSDTCDPVWSSRSDSAHVVRENRSFSCEYKFQQKQ